ncbi:MAG: hypothetical protein V3W52_17230 [Syntrophobacteria bacterium]
MTEVIAMIIALTLGLSAVGTGLFMLYCRVVQLEDRLSGVNSHVSVIQNYVGMKE